MFLALDRKVYMHLEKFSAIILAAGHGKRMGSDKPKQFLEYGGYPILYYTLRAFVESDINDIIIVTSDDYVDYVTKEIVYAYGLKKVSSIVVGGAERYHSVYEGLKACSKTDYVLIHDGARPFIEPGLINEAMKETKLHKATVLGVPSKDTVKIVDHNLMVNYTPDRNLVWNIQTPQGFEYQLIRKAYEAIIEAGDQNITDDAMVIENTMKVPIKVVMGSYKNIKITTPEDLKMLDILRSSCMEINT